WETSLGLLSGILHARSDGRRISGAVPSLSGWSRRCSIMTFALFILYVVLSYVHPGEIAPALASYRVAYWIGAARLLVAVASFVACRGSGLANLQLAGLVAFAIATCASLVLADRWLGAPLFVIQRFGPSIAMFVLATAGVGSLQRLRLASKCIIGLTLIL